MNQINAAASMSDQRNSTGQPKPRFDPTINYGHVLTAISFFIAAVAAYYGTRAELQNVDQRVGKIESTLQQLANVLVLTARQDERLISIERRVDRLETVVCVEAPVAYKTTSQGMTPFHGFCDGPSACVED
jgi:hypothetical protein